MTLMFQEQHILEKSPSYLHEIHFRKGELFMECVKDRCKTTTGQQCGWKCTPFQGIPTPYPDLSKLPTELKGKLFLIVAQGPKILTCWLSQPKINLSQHQGSMSIEGATSNNQATLATLEQHDQNGLFSVTLAAQLDNCEIYPTEVCMFTIA